MGTSDQDEDICLPERWAVLEEALRVLHAKDPQTEEESSRHDAPEPLLHNV